MRIDRDGRGRIELAASDAHWPDAAQAEFLRLGELLGDVLVRSEHIGSTSIPGLAAKPIIDLLPVVDRLARLDDARPALESAGYEWRGEFGIAGRRLCLRDCPETGARLFNIHFFAVGDSEIARHVAFRDYLRVHPQECDAYERVKRDAAARHPDSVFDYNDAKSPWIKACELRAIAWATSLASDR
ncbi:MAG: GrpB family protein [Planctomyces sp.]|nr:GrpB family protein [Planctomyces sp.]